MTTATLPPDDTAKTCFVNVKKVALEGVHAEKLAFFSSIVKILIIQILMKLRKPQAYLAYP